MFTEEMKGFTERKRLIVLQSELHRGVIILECAALRARLDSVHAAAQSGRRWLVLAGVVTGFLAVRRGRGLVRRILSALAVWRWFQKQQTSRE